MATLANKENIDPPLRCKLVIIGDQGVGKTSIIRRFMHDEFDASYQVLLLLLSCLLFFYSFCLVISYLNV